MEKMLVVQIRLPACNRDFIVRIPAGLNTHVATLLAAQAIEQISEGAFHATKSCILAWNKTGQVLNGKKTISENNIVNGSKLLLI